MIPYTCNVQNMRTIETDKWISGCWKLGKEGKGVSLLIGTEFLFGGMKIL